MKRKIKIKSQKDFTLKGRFSFQTCDESHCLPPYDANFSLKVKGVKEAAVTENAPTSFGEVKLNDGGIEFPEDKVSWKFDVEQEGEDVFVVGNITCVEGWHVYAANLPEGSFLLPTEIILDKSEQYEVVGKIIEPEPEFHHDEAAKEDIYMHSNSFTLKQKIKVNTKENFTIKGKFTFQTCDDSHCLPPYDADIEIKVKGSENAETGLASTSTDNKTKKESKSIWTIFILSFLSGFAALLTPCVFPMIPMTVSFFTKQSKSKAQGIKNALFYGISIITIYVLLGTIVTAVFGSDALNALSTNVWFNILFFVLLVVFAISFMGAFEIVLPSSWVNKADSASDKGGIIGIFFMAFTLALVSFSCTGPIVGTLLVEAATVGGIGPFVGMFGFSFALALPFALFAAFPGWMNTLPKSGGWLNTVKVFLGFLELALAFKFLSNADLVVQGHYLERELFLAIWIGIFAVLAIYLFGFIQLPHDSPMTSISVGRTLLGTTVVIFIIYLMPGLWGAPLKLISGFPPPMSYSESPTGFGGSGGGHSSSVEEHGPEGTHLGPQGIPVFHDMDEGMAYAKKIGKPAFLDFTGHACVNCRKMEENVWGEPGVIDILKDKVVIISLYVDDKRELPKEEQKEVEIAPGKTRMLETVGNKWSYIQATKYKTNTQPYYRMLGPNDEDLANGSADYEHHGNTEDFKAWLEEGLKLYNEAK
ncbi:MAG: thioredoxin family protein [Flavobacteriales bacterium]|nr:thioredoxin family protein [Flavobacteriales bacterium]MCB9363636.1 thioredoxin family protein [Flavobacteriales bacterium]